MNTLGSFLEVSIVIFVATAFRTSFGFGEALIAVPLLSLLLPIKVAAPVAVLTSVVVALVSVIRDHEHIHISSAKKLLLATAVGLPFGLLTLRYAPEEITKGILGLLLLGFSVFSLVRPHFFSLKSDRFIWLFGFLAGVTGGSYGMNGPPLAIFGAARGWTPSQFRATIQAYFLPASLLGLLGYYFSGLWTKDVNILFAYSLPAIVLGILCGNTLAKAMNAERFRLFLYAGLIVVSCVLMVQGLL